MKQPRRPDAPEGTRSVAARLPGPRHARLPAAGPRDQSCAPGTLRAGTSTDEHVAFLYEASGHIGSTLDLDVTVRELIAQVVPRFADFASVHLVEQPDPEHGPPAPDHEGPLVMRRIAVAHADKRHRWGHVRTGEILRYPAHSALARFLAHGEPCLIPHVGETVLERLPEQLDNPDTRLLLRDGSFLSTPLNARGAVLGFLALGRTSARTPFDEHDQAAGRDLAARAALNVDNARRYARQAQAALVLQHSMLPTRLPHLPGIEIAHRYLPCGDSAHVGGDWFDAIALPGHKVAFVVGDVMGHGLHAASVMGQLRTAVQTLAMLDLPPPRVLRLLDQIAQRFSDTYLATCLYCVYDPATGRATIANAGHLPPILIRPDHTARPLTVPTGVPIGVEGVPFETIDLELADGSILALYTDGLIETPGRDIGQGIAILCKSMAGPARSLDEACQAALRALDTAHRRDDAALLMARLHRT